jgi:hypothetical protein
MKTVALLLLVAFPSMSWAQTVPLGPAYPQSDAPVARSLVPAEDPATHPELADAPLFTRWYFWTGIAVIVASVAVTAVLFLTSRNQPVPSTLCGPTGCGACLGNAPCR